MAKKVAIFWPGDARAKPNELALPSVEEATAQLESALKRLGRMPYRVPGFLAKPHEAIEKLGPVDDPMVGVCVHWRTRIQTPKPSISPGNQRSSKIKSGWCKRATSMACFPSPATKTS